MKIKLTFILGVVFSIVLSGCSLTLQEPSTLITAPATDNAQYQERKLLNSLLAADEHLVVPSVMDKPAAAVDVDIDHDNTHEKLVFWSKNNGFETGATLIRQDENGAWTVFDRVSQSGLSIVYFNLVDINQDGEAEVLIGVKVGGYNSLYIYRLNDTGFQILDQMNYSILQIADIFEDGNKQILCALSNNKTDQPKTNLNIYQWRKQGFNRIYKKEFDGTCQAMVFGKVNSVQRGLYMAQTSDYTNVNVTLLLPNKASILETQLTSKVVYFNISGAGEKLIGDINGDGVLEIRSIVQPIDISTREPRDYLQAWKAWDSDAELETVYGVLDNRSDGYRFVIPGSWINDVRYRFINEKGSSQVRFYAGNSEVPSFALFAQDEGTAKLSLKNKDFILLGSTPSHQRYYFVQLNSNQFGNTALNGDFIKQHFQIEGGQKNGK